MNVNTEGIYSRAHGVLDVTFVMFAADVGKIQFRPIRSAAQVYWLAVDKEARLICRSMQFDIANTEGHRAFQACRVRSLALERCVIQRRRAVVPSSPQFGVADGQGGLNDIRALFQLNRLRGRRHVAMRSSFSHMDNPTGISRAFVEDDWPTELYLRISLVGRERRCNGGARRGAKAIVE